LRAILDTAEGFDKSAAIKALKLNNVEGALNAIPWDSLEKLTVAISPILRDVVEKAAAVTSKSLPRGIDIVFDVTNPEAVKWIREHAADMIKLNIMPSSKQAIREIIKRGFEEGIAPRQMADLIKEQIGILPKHAEAVETYRKMILQKFKDRGLITAEQDAQRLAMQYAQKLIKYRATVIARNETMLASNHGQLELWRQGVSEGTLLEIDWEREWIVSGDERTCGKCMPMNGERAPINGAWSNGCRVPTEIHVQCRCVQGLAKVKPLAKAA
jgi:hypothetical protein